MGYPIILKDVAIIILGAAVDEKTATQKRKKVKMAATS